MRVHYIALHVLPRIQLDTLQRRRTPGFFGRQSASNLGHCLTEFFLLGCSHAELLAPLEVAHKVLLACVQVAADDSRVRQFQSSVCSLFLSPTVFFEYLLRTLGAGGTLFAC